VQKNSDDWPKNKGLPKKNEEEVEERGPKKGKMMEEKGSIFLKKVFRNRKNSP
jgi:sugar phosphate permease